MKEKKIFFKSFQVSITQKGMLIEMTRSYFKDEIERYNEEPFFDDINSLICFKDEKTNWLEFCILQLVPFFLGKKFYWNSRFYNNSLNVKIIHPIDFLYEHYKKVISNEDDKEKAINEEVIIEKEKKKRKNTELIEKESKIKESLDLFE